MNGYFSHFFLECPTIYFCLKLPVWRGRDKSELSIHFVLLEIVWANMLFEGSHQK